MNGWRVAAAMLLGVLLATVAAALVMQPTEGISARWHHAPFSGEGQDPNLIGTP